MLGILLMLVAFILLRFPKRWTAASMGTLVNISGWGMLLVGLALTFASSIETGLVALGGFLVLYHASLGGLAVGKGITILDNIIATGGGFLVFITGIILSFTVSPLLGYRSLAGAAVAFVIIRKLVMIEEAMIRARVLCDQEAAHDSTQENPSENRRDAQTYCASGDAHRRKLEQDQAIFDQTKAIEANPESPGVGKNYFLRGTAYYNKGQYDRAIDDYSNAIEHDAMFLGWIAEPGHIGWGEETRRQIQLNPETEEALRLDVIKNTHQHRRYPFDYYYRASAHYAKGEYDKAILDYTKTIEIEPDMGSAHHFLAEAYLKTGDIDSALKHYDALKRLDEDAANGLLSRIQNMAEFSSMPTQQE